MRYSRTISLLAFAIILGVAVAGRATASAQTTGFLTVKDTWITDSTGKALLLRGVNYPGYECSPLGLHSESDYAAFAQTGFNVVRLPISWANLEPSRGLFDVGFLLWHVDQDVQWAKEYGLYIVLDMHQYLWASKFGGCGAPDWSVATYSPDELGMRRAVSNFWADASLQDQLVMVWKNVARHYANETTIAGYDLFNEPFVYTSIIPGLNASNVDSFNIKATAAIRTVDQNHIIFLEPANMNTYKTSFDSKIVWSPHFYPLSFAPEYYPENVTVLEADLAAKYQTFVLQSHLPMWIGEFGAFMNDSSADNWLRDAKSLFDKYQVGWAWWPYYDPKDGNPVPSPLLNPDTSASSTQAESFTATIANQTRSWFQIRLLHPWMIPN
jgi:endoglycosylceramidase